MSDNPYAAPHAEVRDVSSEWEYVGFWARVGASLIDTALLLILIYPLAFAVYGKEYFLTERFLAGPVDFLISYVLPAVAVILFWVYKSATPGKMVIGARIVDARTGQAPSTGQFIIRYLAYYVSAIALMLGFLWVAWDGRKQGWHDKIANTVVVRRASGGIPARFEA